METILFFDDWALQRRDNLERVLGSPKWVKDATLEDDLTEGTWNFPCVWYDEQQSLWKAIYGGAAAYPLPPGVKPPVSFIPKTQVLLYAESPDGITWTKPDLTDRVSAQVRYRPNQVFGESIRLDGCPVYDPFDPDPNRRLKYVFCRGEGNDAQQGLATSGDGIHWIVESVFPRNGTMDGPTPCFFNPYTNKYVISTRPSVVDRRIAFVETEDFKTYSSPKLILGPDSEDPPMLEFYGMPVVMYEGIFLGFLWRFHTDPSEIAWAKRFGPVDCGLAYSYDGEHFNRAYHKPFIPRNDLGEHGGGCIFVTSMVIDQDHTIRFYSSGSKAEHFRNQHLSDGALLLHTMRLDGFTYLKPYSVQGLLTTKALTFTEPTLKLNVKAPYGAVKTQILDEQRHPVEGLTFADSVPFSGDELFYEPKWSSGETLQKVLGQTVYIEIQLAEAELYGIRGTFQRHRRWESRPPYGSVTK